MSSTAFGTYETSVMVDDDTFLMSIDGVGDLFLSVFLDVSMESTTFTAVTAIL